MGEGDELQNSTPFRKTADITVPTRTANIKTSAASAT
jgi:hypothetical protein